jgi:chromosome segregation protein
MVLKKLTLQGYKTFASRTSFLFDEGITAIVGPNGSGKSNIADALRWVLGEQSYTTLRGKRTIDMIFAGSQTRSRAGMAQATLTLDNSNQWLPIDFTEVEISRRAYRSGENEYVLNGQKVRLKDIMDLLATSGLSQRTYTMIGQGLIDRALSLRADERRALFEEAAGINHYKTRRAETLRRLKETQHNLDRVRDILAEIKPRLNSLKRQATRARNYDQINQDLRHLLRIWYGYKWDQTRADMRLARKAATEAEDKWKESRRTLLVQQQNIDELQKNINRAQQRLTALQEQRENVRERLEESRREAAILKERRQAIHLQLEDIDLELPLLEEQHHATSEQLASATKDLSVSQGQLDDSRQHLQHFKQSFQGQQAEIKTWQNKLSTIEKERIVLSTRIAQAEGQLSQLQKRVQEQKSDSNSEIGDQIGRLLAEQDRQKAVLTSAQENVETLRQQRDRLQDQRRNLVRDLKQLRQKAKKQQKILRRQRDQVTRLETKVDLLGQLRQSEITVGKEVSLIGSLAALIEIPMEYKKAIEAALTSRMATLVVSDSASMWKLAGSKNRQAIHVAALADIRPPASHSVPNDSGVIGWANELVTCQQQTQAVVDLLLGPVLLVKEREAVYQLASSLPLGTLAVSADGFVAYAGGLVEIGGSSETDGILSRETAWREAKKGLEKAQLEVEQDDTAVSQLQNIIQQQQDQVDDLLNEERRLGQRENEALQKVSVAQRRVDHSEQQITYLQKQKERQAHEINRLHEQIQGVKAQIFGDQDTSQSLDLKLVEAQAKLETLPVAEAQQQEQDLLQRITAAETIVAGRLAVVDSRRTTLNQAEQQLSRLKQRQHVLISQKESLANEETAVSQQQLQDQRSELEAMIKPIQARLIENQNELMSIQQKTGDLQRQAHEKETHYTQTQVRFTQQESQIETLQERIHTDLGLVALRFDKDQTGPTPLPISEVVEQLPSIDELPSGIEKSIQQFRGQLQRMGGINPDAPAEFEETQARFEFMTQQVEDLNLTEIQLRQVISELDELTSRAFAETVEKVNDVFGDTFTQLFGGGSARLVLTDPDDLTISGVDIIARLPNRREQGLGLLSGGERSLTASALIFSLLKVSPTPFCVMDEVDAALDEANINRFRDILHELSLKTQFIVITHNRGTVHAAQTIYGVSMQPDSASQVISIRPEEYVRQELF